MTGSAPGKLRVLVVDDEAPIRGVLSGLLESAGYEVRGAASAEEAAAALRAERFALVLLDNSLPGKTGMEALPGLAALAKAPILLMTGLCDEETRRDALLLGAKDFLKKPAGAKEVLDACVRALGGRGPAA